MSSHNDVKFVTNFVAIYLILNNPTFRGNCKAKSSTLCLLEGTVKEKATMLLAVLKKASHLKAVIFLPFPTSLPYTVISVESLTYTSIYTDTYQSNTKKVCSLLLLEFQCRIRALDCKLFEREIFFTAPGK